MDRSLKDLRALYNPADALEKAWTIPAPWYLSPRLAVSNRVQDKDVAICEAVQRGVRLPHLWRRRDFRPA